MRRINIVIMLLASGLFTGCDAEGILRDSSSHVGSLVGPEWTLTSFREGRRQSLTFRDGERYSVLFRDDGTLEGQVDCNAYWGQYIVEDGRVTALDLRGSTEALCPEDSRQAKFWAAMDAAHTFIVSGERLTIRFGQGGILQFEAASK